MSEEPKNKIALRATLRHAFLSDRPKKCMNLCYFGSNWVKIYDVLRKLRRSIWQIPAKRLTRFQQFRFYSRKFSSWGVGGGGGLVRHIYGFACPSRFFFYIFYLKCLIQIIILSLISSVRLFSFLSFFLLFSIVFDCRLMRGRGHRGYCGSLRR